MPSPLHPVPAHSPAPACKAPRRLLAASLCLALLGGGMAAPEPDPVPRRWQLDVEVGPLRVMNVADDLGASRLYFYLTYTVSNNSGQDLLFAPMLELATDEGDLLRAGRDVPLSVTRQIQQALENPLLEDQVRISDTLLQGEENAKDGLAVWPVPDLNVDEIKVYFAGLSGEFATIEVPVTGASGEKTRIVFRKVLMLRYEVPGTLNPAAEPVLLPVSPRGQWIMR